MEPQNPSWGPFWPKGGTLLGPLFDHFWPPLGVKPHQSGHAPQKGGPKRDPFWTPGVELWNSGPGGTWADSSIKGVFRQ
jgi:hypothetical protein